MMRFQKSCKRLDRCFFFNLSLFQHVHYKTLNICKREANTDAFSKFTYVYSKQLLKLYYIAYFNRPVFTCIIFLISNILQQISISYAVCHPALLLKITLYSLL